MAPMTGTFEVVCECGASDCTEDYGYRRATTRVRSTGRSWIRPAIGVRMSKRLSGAATASRSCGNAPAGRLNWRARSTSARRNGSAPGYASRARGFAQGRYAQRVAVCRACGQDQGGARFCNACGAPLDPVSGSREQRKTVTVLFCDVTGSTALGDSSDPEAFRSLLARYFERMSGIVEAHGGASERSSATPSWPSSGCRSRTRTKLFEHVARPWT